MHMSSIAIRQITKIIIQICCRSNIFAVFFFHNKNPWWAVEKVVLIGKTSNSGVYNVVASTPYSLSGAEEPAKTIETKKNIVCTYMTSQWFPHLQLEGRYKAKLYIIEGKLEGNFVSHIFNYTSERSLSHAHLSIFFIYFLFLLTNVERL